MKKVIAFLKKEPMLALSLLAAAIGLVITPPTLELIGGIDWRTLGTLLMMLTVLEGFKKENVLYPVVRLGSKLGRMTSLTLFLVFGVFFSSMFVTNDVSLLIFVPLTITLFRSAGKEKYILPVISMENIAAIRGSLLMPFGSPQNLFLYGKAGVSVGRFMLHMSPFCLSFSSSSSTGKTCVRPPRPKAGMRSRRRAGGLRHAAELISPYSSSCSPLSSPGPRSGLSLSPWCSSSRL